ncbi:MAG TPA: KH domain-containing protein [Thermoanaerobaculia bacterium]|nr:KH domain-containing protein [Thermoanaerobaculia bacterium]
MDDAARDLARVVRHLVDQPEAVRVRELQRGRSHVLDLEVAPEDMGSVIGRGGRTAQALRVLLRNRGDALGISYDLKIREPGEPRESARRQERG